MLYLMWINNVGESCNSCVKLVRIPCRIGTTVTKFLGFSKFSFKSDFKSTIRMGIIKYRKDI